jgi:hypothetical protein
LIDDTRLVTNQHTSSGQGKKRPSFIIQWTEQKEGPLAYKLQLQEDETATDHFSDLSGE